MLELPPLGETFRRRRLERGLSLADAAAELGLPASSLRAIEWGRRDLLGSAGDVDRIEREYAAFLGLDGGPPAAAVPPPPRRPIRAVWVLLLAGLASSLVLGLVYVLEVTGDDGNRESARQVGPPPPVSRSGAADEVPTAGEASASPARPKAPAQGRRPVNFTLSAVLGESWVEAHSGSPTGPLLFRGTLARGRKLRLAAEQIWVRFGAVSNLSFALNGRPVLSGLQGTVDVLVTQQGIRRT